MATPDIPNALDANAAASMRHDLATGAPGATRRVAQQFEGMFLNMVLKSMRDALPHSDPLDSDSSRLATSLYDNQISQSLASGKGTGLADALVKQMDRARGTTVAPTTGNVPISRHALEQGSLPLRSIERAGMPLVAHPAPAHTATAPGARSHASASPVHTDFVEKYHDAASAASEASGIPTKVILGQAALESGWGKHEVRDAQGNGSFNLFGIKAGASWKGSTVEATTTEFIDGVAQKVVQKFRAYSSYAESFLDYAHMVANNPRFAQAVHAAHDAVDFARAMGSSGYATDPAYASKLASVLTGPLRDIV
jgi:flagellar protein FlgJ